MQSLTLMKNNNYYLCEGYETKTINKKILFFHIPKCGGTTVTNILAHLFLWQSKDYYRLKKISFEKNKNYFLKKNYDFIYGHIPYYYTKYFQNRFLVTVIRDPVERFISHINHEIHRKRIKQNISLEECLEKELVPLNLITRLFSKNNLMNIQSKDLNDKNLYEAINILEREIDLVVDITKINFLINYLISKFDFPNVLYQWTQQSKGNFFEINQNREIISYYNSLDVKLYSHIKNSFSESFDKKEILRKNKIYLLFNNEIKINNKKDIFFEKNRLLEIKNAINNLQREIITDS